MQNETSSSKSQTTNEPVSSFLRKNLKRIYGDHINDALLNGIVELVEQHERNANGGWVLVPPRPTTKMFAAFITETLKLPEEEIGSLPPGAFDAFAQDYKAMLEAAHG